MTEPKPLASLSGSLLARKGAARPAMRPQVQRLPVEQLHANAHLEDLGWDDMGEAHEQNLRHHELLALTPAPVTPEAKQETEAEDRAAAAQLAQNARLMSEERVPEVVRQQDMLARKLDATSARETAQSKAESAEAEAEPVERKQAAQRHENTRASRPARESRRRAAFTLRLDEQRHLKLRLASTINGRSAQQLVTRALDRLLDEMPELELLAAQVKRGGNDSAN